MTASPAVAFLPRNPSAKFESTRTRSRPNTTSWATAASKSSPSPGSDKWHGQAFINDSDGSFNARNPFVFTQPDFSSRQFGGNLSGGLNKKTSIFFDIEDRQINDNGIIVAQTLNSNFIPTSLNEAVATPQSRLDFSPRIDYQINDSNTLVVKFNFESQHDSG